MCSEYPRFQDRQESYMQNNIIQNYNERQEVYSISLRRSKREEFAYKRRQTSTNENTEVPFIITGMVVCLPRIVKIQEQLKENCSDGIKKKALEMFKAIIMNPEIGKEIIKYSIENGLVLDILGFVNSSFTEKLVAEAVSCLSVICYSGNEFIEYLKRNDAIAKLIGIIDYSRELATEQALYALGNISGEADYYRDILISLDFLSIVLNLIEKCQNNPQSTLLEVSLWNLGNLVRWRPIPFELGKQTASIAKKFFFSPSEKVVAEALRIFLSLSNGSDELISEIFPLNVIEDIMNYLNSPIEDIHFLAVKIIGNLATGDDGQVQKLLDLGLLGRLLNLSFIASPNTKQNIMWILGNITCGSHLQRQQVLDHTIFNFIMQGIIDPSQKVRLEASFAINHIVHNGNDEQALAVIDRGFFRYVKDALRFNDPDFLYNIIEFCQGALGAGDDRAEDLGTKNMTAVEFNETGCLDVLEKLQDHNNGDIYKKVVFIITTYFGIAENVPPLDMGPGVAFS
ncbi:unnamed protein product [Blepharisma stoltei]|uniref:Importin subunit alpha n=1 Tax=Blepharisma stoltei TaxID=1481888 RepID=A0AAU9KES7_9CILI|nr:unnamed protein product [Blepharisma stoltei]